LKLILVYQFKDHATFYICGHSFSLKGTVHPQMKTLLSFTHPQFVSNTKEDILKNVGNQTADGPHSMKKKQKKKKHGSQWDPINCLVIEIL